MIISIPDDVNQIINTLNLNGHEACIVGGCVRDSIMGVTPKDWDITTSAQPHQVTEIFPRTFETGIKHGTVTVLIGRQGYEVTTYRIDGTYLDSRRPQSVTFTTSIEEDLSRRDFTMNAIAYSPCNGFTDPFGGQADIAKKIIRCVGNADCRFGDDALRMLRAVRFAGQLGFTIDAVALAAIGSRRSSLANISVERIRDELVRLITSPYVVAVSLLESTCLLPYVLAGHAFDGDLHQAIRLLEKCPMQANLRLTVLLACSGGDYRQILRDLRFDNKTVRDVSLYADWLHATIIHNRYEIKKYLRQMPQVYNDENSPGQAPQRYFENLLILKSLFYPDDANRLEAIRGEAIDILASGECYNLRDLLVKGEDLIAAGVPRGREIGDKLEELLDAVMHDPAKNMYFYNCYRKK